VTGWWFSHGTLVSFTNKNDCHYITEILLKVALNTITLNPVMILHVSPTEDVIESLVSHRSDGFGVGDVT
jgi:hypothetical protein